MEQLQIQLCPTLDKIEREIILAKIFEKEGFTFDKIVIFRKRGGKAKLYETGVCVSY